MTLRNALLGALLVLSGCSGSPTAPRSTLSKPARAVAPPVDDQPVRPAGAIELGEAGDLATIVIAGDHAYWASREEREAGAYVRRAPLAGGVVEELARVGELGPFEPALAVVGDEVFVTSAQSAPSDRRGQDAVVLRIADHQAQPFARALGIASAGLVGHEGHLYWVAATAVGPGVIVSTRVSDARTRTLVPCPDAQSDCGELVPGTPPVAVILDDASRDPLLHRLGPDVARRGTAAVPVGLDAVAVLGDHVLCAPVFDGEEGRSSVLVPLGGGDAVPAPGLDGGTLRVGDHYYHITEAGLVRRAAPGGDDEVLASAAQSFAASGEALVWVEGGTVWTAPLPP